ncbi:hypothetical protein RHCRD62_30740 [Rhodococcus sp. RD6.2]|nr:hypothetical protein RHCRD62_30740 [Rhodococcus sp. RD6.2]
MYLAGHVAGGTTDRLNQAGRTAQESFLVGIEDRDEGDLRKVEALAKQVDADQDVVLAEPQLTQQLDATQGVDVRVQVPHTDAEFEEVVREVLGHLLGQCGDEDTFVALGALPDLVNQVVDLPLRRLHHDLGVDEPGRANHLFDELTTCPAQLVRAGCRGQVHRLPDPIRELLPGERPVVGGRREAEAVLDEVAFAGHVALVHRADLRHGHMRLVDDEEEVLGEVVDQGRGCRTRGTAVDVTRIVLDSRAEADLLDHLEVVIGAHPQPLRLQQLAPILQIGEALLELRLDVAHRALHPFRPRDVVGGREDAQRVDLPDDVTGQRVQVVQGLDLVTEELDAHREFLVRRNDLHGVPANPERAPRERDVVAVVLHVDEQAQECVPRNLDTDLELDRPVQVGLRRAKTVDARHRRDHDHVAPRQQTRRRRVPQPLDVVVDRRVLLDVGVRLGDVRLGLVVVVVRDEVLDRVVGEHLAQFVGQLRGEGLVRRHHERRTLHLLDQPRRRRGLAGARRTKEHDVLVTVVQPSRELGDRLRLIACRLMLADDLEPTVGPFDVADRPEFGVRHHWMLGCKRHALQGRRRDRQGPVMRGVARRPER